MIAQGVGHFHIIDGIVNSAHYQEILSQNLLPTMCSDNNLQNYIFQQDGASCHTAKSSKLWLKNNNISVLDWPSSSPDLNPL